MLSITYSNSIGLCIFQFLSVKSNLDKELAYKQSVNFSVIFSRNRNYTAILYGTVLNSCLWILNSAFNISTPGDVYKRVIHYDTTENVIARQQATLCYCDKVTKEIDCFKDNFTTTPIYPGQTIPINLIPILKYHPTVIYPQQDLQLPYKLSLCQLISLKSFESIQFIPNNCTSLLYTAFTTSLEPCSIVFSAVGFTIGISTFYQYYISFKMCPTGFELQNGICDCNKYLKAAMPTLHCEIDMQTFNVPRKRWIGYNVKQNTILFTDHCVFCPDKPSNMRLDNPNTQCIGHRTGLQCGQCPPGLSAVFGSFKCKKCSNDMLWLLPVFFIAGILLVFCLFTLNLTVVDGKINGFIVYANLTVVIGYYAYPSRNNILFVILSLYNLDLGIETCFYHGMTEYDKTWLQFVFPLYLLCIVGVLAITSRYSSYVERLTRRRAIPVIAAIFLLSYSKILLVTTKVLFSFTTVQEIDGNKTERKSLWMWDTHVSVFGIKFISVFIVNLLVFLFILLPLNFLLVFTKLSYKCKFVSKYLKPYFDAYQAPFKINHYYYLGIELLIRPILFAISNAILLRYKTLAIYTIICIAILLYLCTYKPFRSTATTILYISYIANLESQAMLVLYYYAETTSTAFTIAYKILIIIALIEFGCTVFYCLYINHLYKIMTISTLKAKVCGVITTTLQRRFISKLKDTTLTMEPVASYEQLQEELLTADPNK